MTQVRVGRGRADVRQSTTVQRRANQLPPSRLHLPARSVTKARIPRHRHPREDSCEDVGVAVSVGVVKCGLS